MHLPLLALATLLATPAAAAPWDEPFGDPEAILEAANALPAESGHELQMLLEEAIYDVDSERRVHSRTRLVYQVHSVDSGDSIRAFWTPWFQDPAKVEARVILPDGTTTQLDPATLVTVKPASRGDVYRETEGLEGPLPRLEPGAVVERIVTQRSHTPFFPSGEVTEFTFAWERPPQRRVVEIRSAKGVKVKAVGYGLPKPTRSKAPGGVLVQRFELADEPLPDFVQLRPRDSQPIMVVRFTTGTSWAAVAKDYKAQVDARLEGADLAEEARTGAAGATEPLAIVSNLFDHVRRRVRYTGLEFGVNALVPVAPSVTLERGYGDCKDQSTLLVGLLREHGIDASVALLNASDWLDVDPDLPGLKVFDHAIVYVPSVDLWLDPTDSASPAGELRTSTEGRLALVAHGKTRTLKRTTRRTAEDNTVRIERVVHLQDEGLGRVEVTVRPRGGIAQDRRDGWVGVTDEDAREYLLERVQERLVSSAIGSFAVRNVEDPALPFELYYEALDSEINPTTGDEAAAVVDPAEVLVELIDFFEEPGDPERTDDVALTWPHRVDLVTRVVPPPNYSLFDPPPDLERAFGPATFRRGVVSDADSTTMTLSFTLQGRSTITAPEAEQVREAARWIRSLDYQVLVFRHDAYQLTVDGRFEEALAMVRADAEEEPDVPLHRLREATFWVAAGLPSAAVPVFREMTQHPELADRAWREMADACGVGLLGGDKGEGWDRGCRIEALKAAIEIDPEDPDLWIFLGDAYEHSPSGHARGPGADLAEAAAAIRKALTLGGPDEALGPLLTDTARSGDSDGLVDIEEQHGDRLDPAIQVALRSATQGVDAGVRLARGLGVGDGGAKKLQAQAYQYLIAWDRYAEAIAILELLVGPASPDSLHKALDLLRQIEAMDLAAVPDGPEGATHKFWTRLLLGDRGPPLEDVLVDPLDGGEFQFDDIHGHMARGLGSTGVLFSPEGLARIMLTNTKPLVTRLGAEFAVVALVPGDNGVGRDMNIRFVVRKVGGTWKISVAMESDEPAEAVLSLLSDGHVAPARHLMEEWHQEMLDGEAGEETWAVERVWPEGRLNPATLEALALIAACPPTDCLDALTAARKRSAGDLMSALAAREAEVAGKAGELDVARAAVREGGLDGPMAADIRLRIAKEEGDEDEARERLREWLDHEPRFELYELIPFHSRFADLDELNALEAQIVEDDAYLWNELAWALLLRGEVSRAIELAERAVAIDPSSWPRLHTLATAYADAGRPQDALRVLRQAGTNRPSSPDRTEEWYVIGRIAEHYGAVDAAREAYERLEEPPSSAWSSSWTLGQSRLDALQTPQPHPTPTPPPR